MLELRELESRATPNKLGGAGGNWTPDRLPPAMGLSAANLGKMGRAVAGVITDSGMEGAGATGGQAVGAATGPFAPVAIPVLGGVGAAAGNILGQIRRGQPLSAGEAGGAFVGGMIPGAPMAGAGVKTVAKEMGKQGAGNLVAATVQTGISEGRVPTLGEAELAVGAGALGTIGAKILDRGGNAIAAAEALKRSQDATRRETLKLGKDLGYVLPPSVVRPSTGNDLLNSFAGKAATAQEAVRRNQPITNAAVREEIGLMKGDALSPQALNVARLGPNAVYAKIAAVSPQAKISLDSFKQSQADANSLFSQYRSQFPKDPAILQAAKQKQIDADDAMVQIDQEVTQAGKPNLVADFTEARQKLAKIGLVERSLNKGDGNIDAKVIGDAYDAGEKLSGNFLKIGRFQNAFSAAVREASKTPPSGVNQLLPFLAGGAATQGMMMQDPRGALAAAAILGGPRIAREAALSPMIQRGLTPGYGPTRQDIPAMLARFTTQAAGRNPEINQFLRSLPKSQRKVAKAAIEVATAPVEAAAPEPVAPPPPPEPVAAPAPQAPQFAEGQIYRDPVSGIRKRFVQGQWVDL